MSFDFQANVIGSILAKPFLLAECDLSPSEFLDTHYSLMFQAILDVEGSSDPVDVVSVAQRLNIETKKNYLPRLGELVKDFAIASSAKSMRTYVDHVRHSNREHSSKIIAEDLLSGKLDIDQAIQSLMSLSETRKNYDCKIVDAVNEHLVNMDEVSNNGGKLPGISTGIKKLDQNLGGLQKGDLIIAAARPAMGKTAFMVNLALACNVPCGIISTEQPRDQIGARSVAIDARVSLQKMRTADLEQSDWTKMSNAMFKMKDKPIYINDKPSATINDIVRQARKWKQVHDIQCLYVDYLQHIPGDNRSPRHLQIEEIVRSLKNLARELSIPVVALAQVNRRVEERTDKRPYMSDIKDSGSIEQEADQVMTLYRDEVYFDDTMDKGVMEINVLKNRHGPNGMVRVSWLADYVAIKNLDARYAA